ncbi:MAG: YlmH/Sll1252 family protein [Bacillota bacterium]|nr:YlmH/Sll1252 family protein [Bacillota bacterium]
MNQSKDDKILLANAEDKFQQCIRQYRITYTNFLDLRQRSLVSSLCKELARGNREVRCAFFGGYEDAERTLAVFFPDYVEPWQFNEKGLLSDAPEDCPLSIIRIKAPAGGRKLTHRDYLGSLTGLGLKREMIGDILTTENGADVIIMDEIKGFLLLNYSKAGRANLLLEAVNLMELSIPETKTALVKDTVASLRLDNLVASAFSMSRAKAAEAIRTGIVFIDSAQAEKPDMQVAEGAKLVLRGKGKAYLRQVGGRTRKDRIAITIERYL